MSKTLTVELPSAIFDVQTNVPLLHQVVVAQLAAARQGTHKTKNRAEVSGAGRKPHAQKGTGRARQGSIRAPHMTGGGVVHGPTPRDYSQRTPKKMKAAALRGALSDRARNGRIHVVAELVSGTTPSTKAAKAVLAAVSTRRNLLVVIERANDATALSVRNITNLHVLYVDQLNTYDVLVSDDIVFTQAAYDVFVSGRAASEAFASSMLLVEDLVSEDSNDDAEGTIKGNKDSMKYHVPGSRWYDATEAEVWFTTVEDAKAAGFVPAGGEAAQTIKEDGK